MILIRADGGAKAGAGHLMRCLTVADALRGEPERPSAGAGILFVCADGESGDFVSARGYRALVLHTDSRDLEGELPAWEGLLGELPGAPGAILVDSYFVTEGYLKALGRFAPVALLDDMALKSWPADALINYNVYARKEMYVSGPGQGARRLFLGGDYIPVRPRFLEQPYQVRDRVREILITVGGGDPENITGRILESLWDPAYEYHLVLGRYHPGSQALEREISGKGNVALHRDVQDMAGLMARCDLAVTAGGTTVYELCALGLPFVCFSCAPNQEALTEYMGREGVGGFAGAYHKQPRETLSRMAGEVRALVRDPDRRRAGSQRGKALVDGRGARRIAGILRELAGE